MDNLRVNCYSGHTYAQEPRSFEWAGREYAVEKIERAWVETGERHFRVRTADNKLFQLCYNESNKLWTLIEPVGG
jgi:hypothetical protein